MHAEVRDPVGPNGIDWVRNPSTNNAATDSGFNGSRFVQTRTWTVGDTTVTPSAPAADITLHTANTHPVAGDEVVYVETNHPATGSSRSRGRSTASRSRTRPTAATWTSAR